jgi:RNA polymerase sigma-70 factor, ECF subfamily
VNESLSSQTVEVRRRFDAACAALRPDLHRFCTRMTGSPCDGEDVLQDSLAMAFYRLSDLEEAASLRSWLFRIAHNKCIDFLRIRRPFAPLDEDIPATDDPASDDHLEHKQQAQRAISHMVTELAPKERACVVLKDLLDCSLEETAEITQSTVGAVKTALNRARAKLETAERASHRPRSVPLEPKRRALAESYVNAFNRRDWDSVRALLSDEARLVVVQRTEGPFTSTTRYFTNYERLPWNFKLALAWVDGVECAVLYREVAGAWVAHSVIEISVLGDKISLVRDYVHVEYLLCDALVTDA